MWLTKPNWTVKASSCMCLTCLLLCRLIERQVAVKLRCIPAIEALFSGMYSLNLFPFPESLGVVINRYLS